MARLSAPHFDQQKINWTKEWLGGAGISFMCTLAALHAGTEGVVAGTLAAHVREFVVIGGMSMSMVCFYAAVVSVVGALLDKSRQKAEAPAAKGMRMGNLSTAKFMKIFLP